MKNRKKKAGNAKLKDAVLQACILLSEIDKVIKEEAKKQFSIYVGDQLKSEFQINTTMFGERYVILSRSELLMLVNLVLRDELYCSSPLENISIARWYSFVMKKITIRSWFRHLLNEIYHIRWMPGGIAESLLSQVSDIIPKEWLER